MIIFGISHAHIVVIPKQTYSKPEAMFMQRAMIYSTDATTAE
jgi:hypothetical protein